MIDGKGNELFFVALIRLKVLINVKLILLRAQKPPLKIKIE